MTTAEILNVELPLRYYHRELKRRDTGGKPIILSPSNLAIAGGLHQVTFGADIAGMVAAMTESELGVASERASCNILG